METNTEDTPGLRDHVRCQRLPGDAVARNTEELPDNQRSAIRWLHAHGDERGLTNKQLGELIGYSESTIGRVFAVKYDGNLDEVSDAIEKVRTAVIAERKSGKAGMPFIETNLSKHIFKLGKAALEFHRIAYGFGQAQTGKSTSARELCAQHKGEYTYWEMPVGGALGNFMANGAKAKGFSARGERCILRRRLLDSFDSHSLIVIDQVHRVFMGARGEIGDSLTKGQLETLDFIIELFDARPPGEGPGILLLGTNVFRDGIRSATHKNFFRQLRGRSLNPEGFQLPDVPSNADLNAFARHYKLQPASGAALDLQTEIITTDGLAVWLTRLASAHKRATKLKRAMVWDDVIRAHDAFIKIGRYEGQEEAA